MPVDLPLLDSFQLAHQSWKNSGKNMERKCDECLCEAKGKKDAYTWDWEMLMGIRGFSCDDSTHDLCRYRRLLWPWELPHFVLMFGLTRDCGSWNSQRGYFFFFSWPHSDFFSFCVYNLHHDQYPPEFMWVFQRYYVLLVHWGLNMALNPLSLKNSFLIFCQAVE